MTIPVLQHSSKEDDSTTGQMPTSVKEKLAQLGLNGELESEQILHIETDLDAESTVGQEPTTMTSQYNQLVLG